MNEDEKNDFIIKFEGIDIEVFIDKNNDFWVRPIEISKAIGYSEPKNSTEKILERNADYFKDEIKEFPARHGVSSEKRLSEVGMYFFLMCSKKPKAKEFKLLAAKSLKERRKGLIVPTDPLQQTLAITEGISTVLKKQIRLEAGQKEMSMKHEILEERVDLLVQELVTITNPQQRKLQKKVNDIAANIKPLYPDLDRKLYFFFYFHLKGWFDVPRYDEIPKERFPESIQLLDDIEYLIKSNKLNMRKHYTTRQLKALIDRWIRREEDENSD